MKKAIKRLLPASILNALWRVKTRLRDGHDPFATPAYSQEGEDMVLRSLFFRKADPGFYVDVGAHHPRRFSNTYLLYKQGWRGINIEPNPSAVALFRKERTRDTNLAIGVSDEPGELTYYMFDEPAVNTFDRQQALAVADAGDFRIVGEMRIPVRRLDDILREHLPKESAIDVLTVDVEGHDLNVLLSNDWITFRPGCVLVEACRKSLSTVWEAPVHAFLVERGYELFAKTANTLVYVDAIAERGRP
jgi:FkbM family methyltransferase